MSPQASQEVRREIPAGQGGQTRNSYQCFVLNKLFECVLSFPPDRAAQTRLLRLRLGSVKVQPEVLSRTGNTFSAIWHNRTIFLQFLGISRPQGGRAKISSISYQASIDWVAIISSTNKFNHNSRRRKLLGATRNSCRQGGQTHIGPKICHDAILL